MFRTFLARLQVATLVPALMLSLGLSVGMPADAEAVTQNSSAIETVPGVSSSEVEGDESWIKQAAPHDAINAFVIGGSTISISSAPWQVALLNVVRNSPANQFDAQFCGGSIIHAQWILTAAHCVTSDDGYGGLAVMSRDDLRILAGTSSLSTQTLDLPSLHKVSQIIVHPDYQDTETALINDIALVKLSKPLTFVSNKIQQIAVSDAKPIPSSTLNVSGWGAVYDDPYVDDVRYTTSLQRASQQASNDGLCASAFAAYVASSSLCVSDFGQNYTSSACYGDSGGPVTQIWSGFPRLVGVVSFGSGAGCATGKPWVAANVSSFLPWLNSTVNSLTVSGPIYSAAGYQTASAKIDLSTLTALNVELKVFGECDHDGSPSGRSDQDGCVIHDPAAEIDSGDHHSCALLESGSVQCWGLNDNGQLGNGSRTQSTTPVRVQGVSDATAIDIGYGRSSCALLENGTVKCWGQFAIYGDEDHLTSVTVPGITSAIAISSGGQHRCALLQDGSVQCWGNNGNGQGGNGGTNSSSTPVSVSGISSATAIAAGQTHTCALLNNGTVKCWGWNSDGQLGNGSYSQSTTPVDVSGISNAVAITSGARHTCALLSTGTVQCWGDNGNGRLGDGSSSDRPAPVNVSGITNPESISAGFSHTCAVFESGNVMCWGDNYDGQLGNGNTNTSLIPVSTSGITTAASISLGYGFTCVVLSDASPKCWGGNFFGELGDGTGVDSRTPVAVAESLTITVNDYREMADFGSTASSLQGSGFAIPQISTSFASDFPQELAGVYELRAIHAESGELIASAPFVISDGETHSFTLTTDAKKYFPLKDNYLDSILVSASARGQFGEPVPMRDGKVSLQLHRSQSVSKTCSLKNPSVGPASCTIKLDQGKFASSAFVTLAFKDLHGNSVVTSGTKASFSIEKTAVSSVSVSRNNSTVFPTKDGYKDSSKITIKVSSSLGTARGVSLKDGSKVTIKRGSKVVKSWNLSSSGSKSFTWDGKDGGRIVPGKYTIAVQAIGPEGSKSKTSSITVSAKKLVSVTKTTTYKGSDLLEYYESYDRTACVRNTRTGETEIWTLMFDALCYGTVSLPSDAKHEYGSISVSAQFKVTDNQISRCFYDTFAYISAGSTLGTSGWICGNGTFTTPTRKVSADTRTVQLGVYAAEYEEFNVKSVTVTFKYKTLK